MCLLSGKGSGFRKVTALLDGHSENDITLGARLRYEIRPEFAPYVGIAWTRIIGETANLIEKEGGDVDSTPLRQE